jgi:hypothetical protein
MIGYYSAPSELISGSAAEGRMRREALSMASVLAIAVGCSQPAPPPAKEAGRMGEVAREVRLSGFDPEGEPVIRVMADGNLYVVFNLMPPSWAPEGEGLGRFEDFDKQLERVAGVPVEWEDREFFLIRRPGVDTIDRVRRFIEAYRRE